MSETVTRIRMVDSGNLDRYRKSLLVPETSTLTAHSFAPTVTGDIESVDTNVSSDGGTLYFRAPDTAGSLPGDKWTVRGTVTQVLRRCDDGRWRFVSFQLTPYGEQAWPALPSESRAEPQREGEP